ncbi:MAG: cyclic nucleotide-binding domain-containing protein [Proteobacteria bacterium]|nr:cyclic nucleotide-binding domain-containing protein [Pseudomonadota bacterium]
MLVSGKEVNQCGPGACIGELAVLAPAPRTATVIATEPTDALVLGGPLFRDLLHAQPLLVEGVLEQVARRLRLEPQRRRAGRPRSLSFGASPRRSCARRTARPCGPARPGTRPTGSSRCPERPRRSTSGARRCPWRGGSCR